LSEESRPLRLRPVPLLIGAAAFLTTILLPSPAAFSPVAWPTFGLALWMAIWWASEAVPLAATALLPLAMVPLIGVPDPASVLSEYANTSIFLILGGFLIGLAMERCGLHRRIAFSIVAAIGGEPRRLVLGMMTATAFVSMWVSNTSTTLMMLPVASSLAALVLAPGIRGRDADNFGAALMLGVAYAATIGGLGTLIGTPTNALVQGFMSRNFGVDVTFAAWLVFGLPTVALLLPAAWWLMTRVALPFNLAADAVPADTIPDAVRRLGPVTSAERRVAVVALLAAGCWIARPWLERLPGAGGLSDTVIAIVAGLALFLIPSGRGAATPLLDAEALRRVPWDVLVLFGGGLTLAAAIEASTLAETFGQALRVFADWPPLALTLIVVLTLVVWTEFNSNVATAATFMPVLAAMTSGSDVAILGLVAPAAMASSAGFMLPVGSPPNAIVFGTGRITMRQFIAAGWRIDLAAIVIITLVSAVTLPWLARLTTAASP
jgi:sodium-dependent dicarboxylate transporter 2/3/5